MNADDILKHESQIESKVSDDPEGGMRGSPEDVWVYQLLQIAREDPDLLSSVQGVSVKKIERESDVSPSNLTKQALPVEQGTQAYVAFYTQVGKQFNSGRWYPVFLSSDGLAQFENDHRYEIDYSPERFIESLLQKNYLPAEFTGAGRANPVVRQLYLETINRHPHFADGQEMIWRGVAEELGNVPDNYYERRLQRAVGIEADAPTVEHIRKKNTGYQSMDREELVAEVVERTEMDEATAVTTPQSELADALTEVDKQEEGVTETQAEIEEPVEFGDD